MLVKFSDLANDYPFIYLTLYKDESKQERTTPTSPLKITQKNTTSIHTKDGWI